MSPLVIIILVAFVGLFIVARISSSRSSNEGRSVESHKKALEVMSRLAKESREERPSEKRASAGPVKLDLGRLSDLTDPDMIRIDLSNQEKHDVSATGREEESPKEGSGVQSIREPDEVTLMFDDLAGLDGYHGAKSAIHPNSGLTDGASHRDGGAEMPASDDRSTKAKHRVYGGKRSKDLPLVAGGVGAVAIAVGLVFLYLTPSNSVPTKSSSGASTATSANGAATTRTTKTGTSSPTSANKTSPSSTSRKRKSKNLKTAALTSLVPVSQSSTGASYNVPGGVQTVLLKTTAPCWVEDAAYPGGTILWDETLPAGSSYTLHGQQGSLWIRAGNSGALSIDVNGVPVKFNAPPGPYNFTFDSSYSSSSGSEPSFAS
jgi:hypothetical protein